jgi:hypothetical protein
VVAHTCHPSYDGRLEIGGPWSRPAWAKSETLYSKITKAKRAGGVAQAAEYLPHKCQALSTNPTITKKRERETEINAHVFPNQVTWHSFSHIAVQFLTQ